jgi:hypothetical protein
MSSDSLADKLLSVPSNVIFLVVFILILIPYIRPLVLPINITQVVDDYQKAMEDVPQNGRVVISLDSSVGGILETGGAMVATVKFYLNQRPDVDMIIWGMHYDCPIVWSQYIEPVFEGSDAVYGEDYVWLGYIPGADSAIGKLSDDITGVIAVDAYGTPIDQIPIMEGVENANDIDLLFSYDTYGHGWSYIGHWNARYNTKIDLTIGAGGIPQAEVYYANGQVEGFCGGPKGCAELETLLGYPGIAIPTMDSANLALIFSLFLLLICNVGTYMKRLSTSKEV